MREISSAWKRSLRYLDMLESTSSLQYISAFLLPTHSSLGRINNARPDPSPLPFSHARVTLDLFSRDSAHRFGGLRSSVGHMHVQAFDGVASGLPLTLRRKPTSYAPSKSERLAVMPQVCLLLTWGSSNQGKAL